MKNPSLRQELRYEPASVIPLKGGESLLDWLERNNRLVHRNVSIESDEDEDSDEEIAALMGVDGQSFDEDDDDAGDALDE